MAPEDSRFAAYSTLISKQAQRDKLSHSTGELLLFSPNTYITINRVHNKKSKLIASKMKRDIHVSLISVAVEV